MRLFIAEKPSLALAIATGLGSKNRKDGYYDCGDDIVSYCFGHIMQQCNPDEYDEKYKAWKMETLPIIPVKWKLKVSPDCKKQYNIIKQLVSKADVIVNAGDPDREGQLLVDEVLNEFGVFTPGNSNYKPVQRILLNALDDKSVKIALNNLKDNREYVGLRNSALARARADWLIGMNFTRAYTLKARSAGYDLKLSIGRVQTPTAALIARRELEIKNFKPTEFYNLIVTWKTCVDTFNSTWLIPDDCPGTDAEGHIIDRAIINQISKKVQGVNGTVIKVEQKPGKSLQRLPYSLSSLQIDAGKLYGFSPQHVLDIQQSLYEKKLTTYPRSDCEYLPENQFSDIGSILNNIKSISDELYTLVQGADIKIRSRAWNDKKITAHHAIIPTTVKPDFAKLSGDEKKVYELIARAYLAQFYPAKTFLTTTILTEAAGEVFKTTGTVIQELGWKKLYRHYDENDAEEDVSLPSVKEGESVQFGNSEVKAGITKPPARFTPSTIIKAMKEIWKYVKDENLKASLKECSGIGTEATRASIIETIQERGYVKVEKKNLVPTEAGFLLLKIVDENMTYPDITAKWEQDLDAISKRELPIKDFMAKQEGYIQNLLKNLDSIQIEQAKAAYVCPNCQKPLRRIKGSKGFFWSCAGYPECKTSFQDKNGKPNMEPKTKPPANGPKCPKCGKPLVQRKGQKVKFWGCTGYPDCKEMFWDKNGKPEMENC